MVSRSQTAGRPIEVMDAFLAATAETYRLTLVTRNVSHFPLLKTILNPWLQGKEKMRASNPAR
jgi:predicted nucleic acid-binding protein